MAVLERMPKAILPPLALGVAAVAGLVFVGLVDPNEPGHYPTCPFLWLTGLYCPGCGTLRALHALAVFDVGGALRMNPLFVLTVPVLLWWWGRWLVGSFRGGPPRPLPRPAAMWSFITLIGIYWIVRNLPFGAFLAP